MGWEVTVGTWKLTIEYDGTRYYGWQEQRNARTIAGELRAVAEGVLTRPVEISGAGRTDAGVHAVGQVVRLRSDGRQKRVELHHALNDRLPPDINVVRLEEVRETFDPRRDALARYYLYQISTRRTAFAKRFVWWVKDRLNEQVMEEAAKTLVGRHDFASFCDKRTGEGSTIVVVNDVQFGIQGDLLLLRIGASHFLWKMVRRVVGAIVEVGRGKLEVDDFAGLLEPSAQRTLIARSFDIAASTAPPSGLFLERVVYRKNERPVELIPVFPVARW
ncbi:MAG: tRNA pseudouridine(38-40) synthase TruA [Blastocatellia bacterium]